MVAMLLPLPPPLGEEQLERTGPGGAAEGCVVSAGEPWPLSQEVVKSSDW